MTQRGMNRRPSKESPFDAACVVDNVSFTVGADVANVINVAMVFNDATGRPIWQVGAVEVYLSDSADGHTETAVTPTSMLIGTNGLALPIIASILLKLISTKAGLVDINITKNTTNTYYLVVILPTGKIQVSPAIVLT